jgi:hypothetical protein
MLAPLRRAALVILVALSAAATRAEGVFDLVPADALGFAAVRNLGAVDRQIQEIVKIFEDVIPFTPPAPLAFIRAATGLGDGINEGGDALIALLPGDAGFADPKPMLLVPVSDYAALAASVGGDSSGAIARVTIAGEEVLIAKMGDHALLMNIEHRPTMEALLAASPGPSPTVASLDSWIAANDFLVVMLPPGLDALTELGQESLDTQRDEWERELADPEFAEMLANMKAGLDMYDAVLGFCRAESAAGALGVAIDDALNIRISDRIVLAEEGQLAALGDVEKTGASPLAGAAEEPFVFAGGGPMPRKWGEVVAKASRNIIEKYPELYGFDKLDEAQWAKLEESMQATTQGLRTFSAVMLAGGKGDPLYSNIVGVIKVDNADEYMAATKKSMSLWNELTAASTSDIKMIYETQDVEVGGLKGVLVITDVAAAVGDEDVPMVEPMMEAMFGEDAKMRVYILAADENTIIMAVGPEASVAASAKRAAAGESGLAGAPTVQTTVALLDSSAPWTGFVSPQGCVTWFERAFTTFAGALGGPTITFPEYPAGPPIGFSMGLTEGQLRGEMIVPTQTLKDVAAYIKTCQEL